MFEWIDAHEVTLKSAGRLSLLLLWLSLAVFSLVILRLPQDYFVRSQRPACHRRPKPTLLWALVLLLKNLLGGSLILLGLALLLLPGQGLLTILLGLSLTNFPGKYRLEQRLARQSAIHRSLNTVRRWAGKPPLLEP